MAILNNISETTWKWRCRLSNSIKTTDRTLSDFSDESQPIESASTASSQDEKLKMPPKIKGSKSKDPGPGFTASVKTLYEGPHSREGAYNWVDYPPRQLSKSESKAQNRVAIRAYKIKDKSKPMISGHSALKYHMLEIQNRLLVDLLNEVLKHQKIHLDPNELATFHAPFQSLYFGYDALVEKASALAETEPVKPFALLLIRLLDEVFADTRAKLKHLRSKGLVTFNLAWTYFPRDTVVITFNNGETLCKVVNTSYTSNKCGEVMIIHAELVHFDGKCFLWEKIDLEIPKFNGSMPIVELGKYPLEFHPNPREVKERLAARGKKVLDFQGLSHCSYTGIAIHKGRERHNVDCRILVDVPGFKKHHLAQGAREDDPLKKVISEEVFDDDESFEEGHRPTHVHKIETDPNITSPEEERGIPKIRLSEEAQAKNKKVMLAREKELMFISPLIQGYAMKNKLWMSFFVEDIRPITWNNEAYDHLVYEEQQKDLVLSFVESHGPKKPTVEDVIVGKGEGLIVLLSGPPGTGKTLMAEAVADRTKRPLFYLQAEDLGITADILGANIKRVFEMATEWNAVILLDEADVFMAERDPQNIARNELVSIFLRELEYYRGIIFLTTNLYSTIDHAFRSRVSLHLQFPPLTVESRVVVWTKFLNRISPDVEILDAKGKKEDNPGGLCEEDIKELAAWNLNGREIKNAVKMVKSWCDYKGYMMDLMRLENGIKVTSPHASKVSHQNDTSLYDD